MHDDCELANFDKFKYPRSYLEEPTKSVFTELSLRDSDYDAAVELLVKKYAKPGVIKVPTPTGFLFWHQFSRRQEWTICKF